MDCRWMIPVILLWYIKTERIQLLNSLDSISSRSVSKRSTKKASMRIFEGSEVNGIWVRVLKSNVSFKFIIIIESSSNWLQ